MKKDPLELRPTQFVLGMKEVEAKVKQFKGLAGKALDECLDGHVVPCVLGPGDHVYMIDHHHFVAAWWQCQLGKVRVDILADRHDLTLPEFWQFMTGKQWLYLYDQFGHGPHDPATLPYDIRGLADDFYRSLAWELRDHGVIAKVQVPFSEFKWAQWLRETMKVDLHAESYDAVVKRAIKLVQEKLAKGETPVRPGTTASAIVPGPAPGAAGLGASVATKLDEDDG